MLRRMIESERGAINQRFERESSAVFNVALLGDSSSLSAFGVNEHSHQQGINLTTIHPRVICPSLDDNVEWFHVHFLIIQYEGDGTLQEDYVIRRGALMHTGIPLGIRLHMRGVHTGE